MMHAQAVVVAPNAPTTLAGVVAGSGNNQYVALSWADNSANETGFTVERAADPAFSTGITSFSLGAGVTSYNDTSFNRRLTYYYRVFAANVVGDYQTPGFPAMTAVSGYSNVVRIGQDPTPAAPTNLTAQLQAGAVVLAWTDNATNETGFSVERSANGGAFAVIATPGPRNNTGGVTYTDNTVAGGSSYSYRVTAVNGTFASAYSNTAAIAVPAPPAAPSNVVATGTVVSNNRSRINLAWTDNATNETGFQIVLARDAAFTQGVITATVGANATAWQSANLQRGVAYYVRIRAVGSASSSAWINATPFPFTTL